LRMRVMRDLPVVPDRRSRRACAVGQITGSISLVPLPREGRIAIVIYVGSRMRWTRAASTDERCGLAYGETVWSRRPDAGVKLAMILRITQATGARKPGPRGEHAISRKAIAQGMPDCLRCPCMLVCVSC
jgi:hypothetical protein